MDRRALILVLAFLLDAIIGDPQNPWHPIRLIGAAVGGGAKLFGRLGIKSRAGSFIFGMFLSLAVVAGSYLSVWLIVYLCHTLNDVFGLVIETALCYFVISLKALRVESMSVCKAAQTGDLAAARHRLSYIVGRDTECLDFPAIINAAVETVAENFADGVIAPMFFIFLGGAPLGFAYKAVNTLDSMLGYRNERFEYFGKFAARLDDAAGFIPARLAALLMLAASPVVGLNVKNAARVFARDRYNHKSPNSAQSESVCAGALGLRLGGPSFYGAKLVTKPYIGDALNAPEARDIARANRLVFAAALLPVVAAAIYCIIRRLP